ncbi:NAD(P)/FAD-dependent oxidoreductase [Terriglobus sp. ADX1]|uniref:NAD(P)/FAD-dependent oxidoreductase n=1 Tax=Terriglobus sp. ADX1 TaxID=2794063 RepID=UPI002FE54748
MQRSKVKHVVIVGGGFSGLNCARRLARHENFRITLLDRNNYQQFQPLLYQVATGVLSPDNAAFNLRAVLSSHENVNIKMAEVASVDMTTRTARTRDGDEYSGDYLILAVGAEANFFGIPGVAEFAFPLYSLLDAERLRSRLLELLEASDRNGWREGENRLRIAVVGGGPTGVEIAGAIADVFQRTPDTVFKDADLKKASVTLIDQAANVLVPFTRKSQEYASDILRDRGVRLSFGKSVKQITPTEVLLSDGSIVPANLVIWAGGLKASSLSGALGVKTGRGGRIDVDENLTVNGFPGVYALGDFANIQGDDGHALPQLASVAQQAGKHCADNIAADAKGELTTPFKYFDKGIMAMVGRDAAVAEVGSSHHTLTGPLAFAAWLGVHALLLTTARAKIETFLEWAWEYFGHVHVAPILDRPSVDWSAKAPDAPETGNP